MSTVYKFPENKPKADGSYLVLAPRSFPKNSRWLVAEYYSDNETFYSESSDRAMDDVTHFTELPSEEQE